MQPRVSGGQGGGGISNSGTLALSRSSVTGSSAEGVAAGGGIYNNGTFTMTASTVSGNSKGSFSGGGIYNASGGTFTVTDSTISANNSSGQGGGVYNEGTFTLTNSTVSGNSSLNSGAGGGIFNNGTLTLTNATLAFNRAAASVDGHNLASNGSAFAKNSLLAVGGGGGNCSGIITSRGSNATEDASCNFTAAGDLENQSTSGLVDQRLRSNGGPTQTHALPSGSAAIDAADPDACPASDQRGVSRPKDGDGNGSQVCDIGAFELDVTPPQTTLTSGPASAIRVRTVAFEFSSSETDGKFQCSLDGSPFDDCASPKSYGGLADGGHVFKVRAIDAAGNKDTTPATRAFSVDTVKPGGTVVINNGQASTTRRTVSLTLNASDPSPGTAVASMRIANSTTALASAAWQPYSTSKSWTLSAGAGTKTVYVQFRDGAGNISTIAKDTISYRP